MLAWQINRLWLHAWAACMSPRATFPTLREALGRAGPTRRIGRQTSRQMVAALSVALAGYHNVTITRGLDGR